MASIRPAVLRSPFLIVNPKAYLSGRKTLKLAAFADELSALSDIDVIFTAQHVDLRAVAENTRNLIVTAQHMEALTPGRGMGHILPEALVEAGVRAVVLNHAENPLTIADLDATMQRARELGLLTIVCADTEAQCRAIAMFGPDVMICEPTAAIGTGAMDAGTYIERTTRIVKDVNPNILVIQAAGVTSGADVRRVLDLGADGSGGTSGIIKAADWRAKIEEMILAMTAFKADRDAR
ncbi:MAG: triose-phosphate isomerase [Propionibacteriaceae bacterium]|nr:triose-phosphate isomerase [Micropruina sp.]HBX80801.1 triose-phosphate isomerase [Propionibacteriaceae bacterium]